jgi:putative restriction endonuclease
MHRPLGLIAITDHDWFEFLSHLPQVDEVNFWRPSDTRTPRQLEPGSPVIFKLRKQYGGWIVGYGIFARHDVLPAWLAWDTFEEKNGASSLTLMLDRIRRLRNDGGEVSGVGDFQIGCLLLSQPVFLERDRWIKPPQGWPENAVQGKAYELDAGEGARVWGECRDRTPSRLPEQEGAGTQREKGPRYGEGVLIHPRLGQGIFRIAVTQAYSGACAVTEEHSLPALEAAHIRPYGEGGEHEVSNGVLLRSDVHRLFDKGYVSISPDFKFRVSHRLKDDFSNGKSYYPLDGKVIALPRAPGDLPGRSLLEWHMDERFKR